MTRATAAAVDHNSAIVLGQVDVDVKTNEIPMFSVLLDQIDITEAIATADALHVQTGHATYLHRRGAHFALTVKANQPKLRAERKSLPWADVPSSRAPTKHAPTDPSHDCSPAETRLCRGPGPAPVTSARDGV